MERNISFISLVGLISFAFLVACGPSQAEIDATSTQFAENLFSTQTAQAPKLTNTLTLQPSPTLTSTPTATPTPLAPEDIFDSVAPSVAFIETPLGSGSGILIEGGYIITNAHVVWPFEDVRVVFPDGSEHIKVPVLNLDLLIDIAVIGPIETTVSPGTLIDGEDIIIGSDLFLIGYPGEADQFPQPTISRGLLSRTREWELVGLSYFQTDAAVAGGQSGGVLVSEYGNVIGISTFFYTDAFSLVASAVDVLPRIERLIASEDVSGIGDRRLPVEDAQLEHDFRLNNISENQMFVIYEQGTIDIEVESENDAAFLIMDSLGNELIFIDAQYSGIESGTAAMELDAPHFLILGHFSEIPGNVQVRSDSPLVPFNDVDDGKVITVGKPIFANIDHPGDTDYFEVNIEAGQVVDILVESVMIDPIFRVDFLGATAEEVLTDDDSGEGLFGTNAKLNYKAPHSGDYFIVVQGNAPDIGGYILTVDEAPPGAKAVSPTPKPPPEITESPFGPMAMFESPQYPFSIQYPAQWIEQPTQPELGVVGSFQSEEGGNIIFAEENIMDLGLGVLSLNEYADIVLSTVNEMVEGYELVSRSQIKTSQGLDAVVVEYTVLGGTIYASRLIYLHEGAIGFNATYVAGKSRHQELKPIIEYSFNGFRVIDSKDYSAYILRGLDLINEGDLDSGIAEFSKAIDLFPEFAEAYVLRGIAYVIHGNLENAIADYDQAIAIDPQYVEAYYNRSLAHDANGDIDLAMAELDQAIDLDPEHAKAFHHRGFLYFNQDDLDQALADWNQAIDLHPNAELYSNRGNVYRRMGDLDRAMADLNQAIAIDPKYAMAYYNRALTHKANGDIDLAIADYDQTIDLDPKYVDAYNNRGDEYLTMGKYDKAIFDYGQAIEINPQFVYVYFNRGLAYREMRKYDKAIADFDKAIEINPHFANAYTDRGRIFADKGEYDKAIADFDQALDIDPQEAGVYYSRGLAYSNKREYDKAIADFDKAIADFDKETIFNPRHAFAYFFRGESLSKIGEKQKAISDLERALELGLPPELQERAEQLLEELGQ